MNSEKVKTDEGIGALIKQLSGEINRTLSRPVYIQIAQESGRVSIKQIEFLTVEQLASMMHVETRTVYSWIEKAQENGLKFYRAPNTRGVLFEINEVLEWIRNTV
jgi:excisionase family DNA binding protein